VPDPARRRSKKDDVDPVAARAEELRAKGYSYALIERTLSIPYLRARELAAKYDAKHGKPRRIMRTDPAVAGGPLTIPVRTLRNQTASVLHEVERGKRYLVTVSGRTVAELRPVSRRSTFVPRTAVERIIGEAPLDRHFSTDLAKFFDERIDQI
jgi:prevent-host-death family protein